MIISGAGNSQNYSFFNISQSSNEKAPETSRTDKYIPSANNNSDTYNMFGNIQKTIFDSFAGENSFMSAIREVFDNIENKVLSAKDLVDAAAESEEFEKKGSWLTESEDKKLAVIRKAENVYYDGNAKTTVVLGSKNAVINTVNGGNKDTYLLGSDNVITNSGNGNDYACISGSNNVIVNSADGNDYAKISSSNNVFVNSGNGNDSSMIHNSSNVVVNSGSGNDSSMVTNSQDVVINGENGNDTIEAYVSTGIILDGGSGEDIINVTVSEDIIANGGDGADQIAINFSNNAMVDGGDGDDTITINASTNTIVYGGAGNDTITASGIISGGTGDDYIKLSRSISQKDENIQDVIKYNRGDGNDIVEGVTEDTIIELNGISEDEYDITESRNENGTKVKTLTMKDGSGSMTLIFNGSTYSNNIKK
jgi:Ca2+-binding RTX toxin-like protein